MVAHLVAAATGIIVMAAPSLLGYSGPAADTDHIVGPVAVSIGIMAASQILRALRFVNLVLGLILLGSLLLTTRGVPGSIVVAAAGIALVITASFRGRMDVGFGGGWSSLWRDRQEESSP